MAENETYIDILMSCALALARPGGVRYDEMPKYIDELRTKLADAERDAERWRKNWVACTVEKRKSRDAALRASNQQRAVAVESYAILRKENERLSARVAELERENLELVSKIPSERPKKDGLALNAYGRACYDAGRQSTDRRKVSLDTHALERLSKLVDRSPAFAAIAVSELKALVDFAKEQA
jgi:hypothetical protein